MKQEKHTKAYRAVDAFLRDDTFDAFALTVDHKYESWYAMLLSELALLIGEDTVEYAYPNYELSMPDAQVLVFTSSLLLVADINTEFDGAPTTRGISRRSLVSIELTTAARADAEDARAYEWPGNLHMVLTYRGLPKPIELVGEGSNRFAIREASPLVNLIDALRRDLGTSEA
jgi:hypothetical protein